MSDELAFNSKMDLTLLIAVLIVPIVCLWVAGQYWQSIAGGNWPLAVPLALGIALPLWALASLRYFLSDETLRIRCGPLHWRVPIREITEVEPTQSLGSSPAMSADRLKISYGSERAVMISPEPRQEFLRQLEYRRKQSA
jgi:hypothetical protein